MVLYVYYVQVYDMVAYCELLLCLQIIYDNASLDIHHIHVWLVILDFGFAHYILGETEAVSMRGSPLYMAPEIILRRQYNEKADLWSTGVILYGK